MTQELRDDSDAHDQPPEHQADASILERGSVIKAATPRLPEDIKALIAEEVSRQLENRGGADSNYADQELYTERKLREAFADAPHVKSVAYTRKCDDWTLVITHDDEEKSDAMVRLNHKLCDISRDDPRMPVFETWILHVEDAGGNIPSGEKIVVAR